MNQKIHQNLAEEGFSNPPETETDQKEFVLGIDLGTKHSQAFVIVAGTPIMITSADEQVPGGKAFVSAVAYLQDGSKLVGVNASNHLQINPAEVFVKFKLKMGKNDSESRFKLPINNPHGSSISPEKASADVLRKIKNSAEAQLNTKITKAVITVPANFGYSERQATKDAARIAGLEVLRIINEPTAAALAYGLQKTKESKVIVTDIGGGTFDVSLLDLDPASGVFEVIASDGDLNLGGELMDDYLLNYFLDKFKVDYNLDLRNQKDSQAKVAIERLREKVERLKISLSYRPTDSFNLPYFYHVDNQPIHLKESLDRTQLKEILKDLLDRLKLPIQRVLKSAEINPDQITNIVLVGGPCRMPLIIDQIKSAIPGVPLAEGVDPMTVVATGAAIQGSVLAGAKQDIVLLDVTPLSLGLKVEGDLMAPLIKKDTAIPYRISEVFTTAVDNQNEVGIEIYQGERKFVKDNKKIGEFVLSGITSAPRGTPKLNVTFDIDANGMLSVTCRDTSPDSKGVEKKIVIESTSNLTEADIAEAKKTAEEYEQKDMEEKLKVERELNLKNKIYTLVQEFNKVEVDKLQDSQKAVYEGFKERIENLKNPSEDRSLEDLEKETDELIKELSEIKANIENQSSEKEE